MTCRQRSRGRHRRGGPDARSGAATPRRATTRTRTRTSCSARCYTEVIERAGIDAAEVEDVIGGCVQQYGEQMFNVGRNAWLQAGLPMETPATTVDRQCGSAQQAVNFAAALIAAGVHDVVIGGGVEHMGHIPMGVGFKWVDEVGSPWPPELMERYNLVPAGPLGRDDRRPVGDPPLRARRARRALAPARRTRRPRRAASSARRSRSRSTATPTSPTRASARTRPSRRCRSSSRRSSRTARSRPATRRRSPTAPPRCC